MILQDTVYPFSEDGYKKTLETKLRALSSAYREGCLTGRDRQSIHYRMFCKPSPTAAMVICHDSCEASERYLEWALFYYDLGYQVYLFDFRGHGRSSRTLPNRFVTHVSDFDEYARDLADITSRISRKLHLSIMAFGMGALVAMQYMQKNPGRVQSACLVAPLLSIMLPPPEGIYKWKLARSVRKGLSEELLFGSKPYQSDEAFNTSGWHSFSRFAWYREIRAKDTRLQNTAYTRGWLKAALDASDLVLSPPTKRISAKLLLIEAGEDRIVHSASYIKLMKLLQNGHYLCLSEADHRIQNGDQKTLSDLMSLTAEFFQKNTEMD